MKAYLSPSEVSESLIALGEKKSTRSMKDLILLGLLAGAYIGFAAHLATVVSTGWPDGAYGMKKFMAGAVFSLGLMLVMIPGAELFTGNCLMPAALWSGRISLKSMIRNWSVVWTANFAGALVIAFLIFAGGLTEGAVGQTAAAVALKKCSLAPAVLVVRGILANWLVCLAVMTALAAQDISGRILGIFFPVMAFVASGFEHSIANMYFLPAGMLTAAGGSISLQAAVLNILFVTLGNILGGVVFVTLPYYLIFIRRS